MERIVKKSLFEGDKIKGSRFIVNIAPVCTAEEAMTFLESIIQQYSDAGHHCYAYRLYAGDKRCSDSGEPRGSAGSPILQRLEHLDIVDGMVVVTRYFGGVKLGFGGLIRAYGGAAAEALLQAETEIILDQKTIELQYSYSDSAILQSVFRRYSIEVIDVSYGEYIQQRVSILLKEYDDFLRELKERTAGRIQFTNTEHGL